MKTWLFLVAACWSGAGLAATNTASFRAQSHSLTLDVASGTDPFGRAVATVFTTYDGSSGVPLHADGYAVSGELRPRVGEAGIFEADYLTFLSGAVSEYGSVLLNLPANDANTNALPDFLEADTTVNAAFSNGSGRTDYPGTVSFSVAGQLRRNAGALRGGYDLTVSSGGLMTPYSGNWGLLRLTGEVEYSREKTNSLKLTLTLTNGLGGASRLTGTAKYSAPNPDLLALPQLTLTRTDNRKIVFASMSLARVGNRYRGTATAADGNLASTWADFTRFAIEVVDDNDANTNGIPDLTDPAEAPDFAGPRVAFTSPAANAKVTNEVLTVRGTATDNVGVARVEFQYGTNAFQPVTSGTNSWTARVPLEIGTNTVQVMAYDYRGNPSAIAVRKFIRQPTSRLTLEVSGPGSVTPNLNGAILVVGDTYTVTATPARRHVFAGWTGDYATNVARLRFVMQSNLLLRASFVTNPFIAVRGPYAGLFSDSTQLSPVTSGAFKATVTDRGSFSGALRITGATIGVSGQFDLEGKATRQVRFQRTNILTVVLCLDLTNGTDQIIGQISGDEGLAGLRADRPAFSSGHPAPFAGRYTLHIAGGTNFSNPTGDGVASIVVKSNGTMTLSGMLADGTRTVQTAPVAKDGQWPFFVPLYRGRGAVWSWLTFTNDTSDSLTGQLRWFKPASPKERLYPGGFTNETTVHGSTYSAQVMTNFLATHPVAWLLVSGLLPDIQTNGLTLGPKNTLAGPGVRALKLDLPTGLWTGIYTNPLTRRPLPMKAVFQQQRAYGAGYVLETNLSAGLVLLP